MADVDTVCQTDNRTLSYYFQSTVTSTTRTSVRDTQMKSYNGTNLNTTNVTGAVYSGTSETDIIYQQGSSGFASGIIGINWCNNAAGGTWQCDQQYVKFRSAAGRALACHESGHAVGLLHGYDSGPRVSSRDSNLGCMVTPINNSLPLLGANNVRSINETY